MSKPIKVGGLTDSFWKHSERPVSVVKSPAEQYEESTDAMALIAELSRRLNNLEKQITIKVDSDNVVSAITLAEEAILIQSDKVAVLGETSFFDYVRDQNGTATGEIDPSLTLIRGGVIQTERIIAGAWPEQGSVFDLDNGNLIIGGSDNPRFEYYNDSATLTVRGKIKVEDTYESNGTTIAEYGQFQSGTANFNLASGATGNGIIVGSPGIYGLKNGAVKFGFDAASGDAFFGGDVSSEGYVHASGINDATFTVTFPGLNMQAQSSIWGENTTNPAGVDKIYAGVAGTVNGAIASSSVSAGVVGTADASPGDPNPDLRVGVLGVSYNGGIGMLAYSDGNTAIQGTSETSFGGVFVTNGAGEWGIKGEGSGGVVGISKNPALNYGVYSTGILGTSEYIQKLDSAKGRLTLYEEDGTLFGKYRYKFTNT